MSSGSVLDLCRTIEVFFSNNVIVFQENSTIINYNMKQVALHNYALLSQSNSS